MWQRRPTECCIGLGLCESRLTVTSLVVLHRAGIYSKDAKHEPLRRMMLW